MRLHLGGHLDWYDPQKRAWLDLHLDTPLLLTDLLQQLGIPAGEVAIVAVDRRAVPLEGTTVNDENRVESVSADGRRRHERRRCRPLWPVFDRARTGRCWPHLHPPAVFAGAV